MEGIVFLPNTSCVAQDVGFYLVKYLLLQNAKTWLVRKSHGFNSFCCPLAHWWFPVFYSPEVEEVVTIM